MNNIRLEKTIKYMCTAKNKVDEIIKDIEDNTEGYVKKKQAVEKTTKEGQTYYILTVTEEFATEKSVMLIATTTEQ